MKERKKKKKKLKPWLIFCEEHKMNRNTHPIPHYKLTPLVKFSGRFDPKVEKNA